MGILRTRFNYRQNANNLPPDASLESNAIRVYLLSSSSASAPSYTGRGVGVGAALFTQSSCTGGCIHTVIWSPRPYRLVGLVVKASASRAEDPRFVSRLRRHFFSGVAFIFPGRVMPVTSKLALQWLPCRAPGVIGSVLGLVGPVSVYCDWVRWKVGPATSISVWQHVKLSEQNRP